MTDAEFEDLHRLPALRLFRCRVRFDEVSRWALVYAETGDEARSTVLDRMPPETAITATEELGPVEASLPR